jgi:hypothetical protein
MKLNAFFSPVAAAFRGAVLALSKVDGKPGLSADDFMQVVKWTINLRTSEESDGAKATLIADAILQAFANKLPNWPWIPYAIGWVGHYVAKRLKPKTK